MDFPNPLSQLDYDLAELEWRLNQLIDNIWKLIGDYEDLKEEWGYDSSPRPPYEFNLLQTIDN
jgi:hypothetical protein